MNTLQQLLSPYSVETFLSQNWTQDAIHIPAERSQKLQSFFSWADLNDLLNYHRLEASDLHFSKAGQALPSTPDRQEWRDRLSQGATLIVNGVHHRVPTVTQLAADLRHEIGYETHVNLYCSPTRQQGFDCHYDTHDVFILQIEGEKQWVVYRETVPYPTPELPSAHQPKPTEPPYIECVLKPGDVLYIPRGHWHYAIAADQPSLHLTVGIENQSGLHWLGWIVQQLHERPTWRQSLPAIAQSGAAEQQLEQLRQELLEFLQQPAVLTRFLQTLHYRNLPQFEMQLPAQLGIDIFPDGFMTQFRWSPLHQIQVEEIAAESYLVQVGTKQITLKGIPTELARQLFERKEFSILEMADWAPDASFEGDIAPLLTRLVTSGVLQVRIMD